MKTLKLTLEGEPASVEAVVKICREFLDIREEGRNQNLALRPGWPLRATPQVRRTLRACPITVGVAPPVFIDAKGEG